MSNNQYHPSKGAKKVMSDRLQLLDFVIRLVDSGLNLPDGQVKFLFWGIHITEEL